MFPFCTKAVSSFREKILFHSLAETKICFGEKLNQPNYDENENDQIGFSSSHERSSSPSDKVRGGFRPTESGLAFTTFVSVEFMLVINELVNSEHANI